MRFVVLALVVAACHIPDKNAPGGDGGADAAGDTGPNGPIDTMITSAPPQFSNTAQARFEFTSNDPNAEFRCGIDGAMPSKCSSPFVMGLPDGAHTFSVRASDGSQVDDTPAEDVWTIDTVAPDTMITSGPPAADNSTMVMFFFTSNEMNVTFDCSLDSAAYAACNSGDTFGPIADGAHSFAVRAHDRAGNVDASPAIAAWVTDTSTPDTQITSGPMSIVGVTTATFTFQSPNAGPGAWFDCALDSPIFIVCSSPTTLNNLSEGSHTFQVRVHSAAGNVDPSPATSTWVVDLTPPTTMITSGPTGTVASTSAAFTFTSNEQNVTFSCSLDGGAMAACTSPFSAMMLAQGPHTFAVAATDAAGHTDPTPATATWTVDTIPPTTTFTQGPANGATTGPYVTFAFTVSEGMPSCALDGGAAAPCTSPVSMNLPAGTHTFSVSSTDAAGNMGTSSRMWTVACGPPNATGAAGLLHLDTAAQSQPSDVGQAATLGDTAMPEATDPTFVAAARFNGGFSFGQTQKITWPAKLGPTGALTIELWSNPDASASGPRDMLVSGDGTAKLQVLAVSATQVRYVFSIGNQTVMSAPVAGGAWHHVLASYGASSLRLWVDGVRTENDNGPAAQPSFDNLIIGANYSGTLDEIWIAQSAITTDDAALARYCPI
jgi:hypothetical protein